jgi:hypothetical protein
MADTMYLRRTSDEELRAKARERVARTARSGLPVRELYEADDLAWSYQGHEAELAQLEQEAADAAAAQAAHEERATRTRALQAETDRVLAEWEAERRAQAEAEARKRLGWKKGERP